MCLRHPPEKHVGAIAAAASAGLDWDHFVDLTKRHRVPALAWNALAAAKVEPPDHIASLMKVSTFGVAQKSLKLANESVRLQAAFDTALITVLFVKGSSLEKLAYGRLGSKLAWDIDLVCTPRDVVAADHVLLSQGYRRVEPPEDLTEARWKLWRQASRECIYHHPERNLYLELHWRLDDNPHLIPTISAASPAREVSLFEHASLRTLNDDELFSFICVHGARHAWSKLKWLADLGAYLGGKTPSEIERLYRRSQELQVGRCSAQALLLCEMLLSLSLPPALSDELQGDARAVWLVDEALRAAAGGSKEIYDRFLGSIRIRFTSFLFVDSWRYRLAELRSLAVGREDVGIMPLPSALFFLYPILRIPSWIFRVLVRRGRGAFRPWAKRRNSPPNPL